MRAKKAFLPFLPSVFLSLSASELFVPSFLQIEGLKIRVLLSGRRV